VITFIKDFIANIGLLGCFTETKKILMIGEIILVEINLKNYNESIGVKGEAANADRLGVGIVFKDVSNYLSEKLRYIHGQILSFGLTQSLTHGPVFGDHRRQPGNYSKSVIVSKGLLKPQVTPILSDQAFCISLKQCQKPSCLSENRSENGHIYQ